MPKLPDKFEDWTPPWNEGEFDAERAAKRIFGVLGDLEKARERASTLSTENETLKKDLQTANDDLEDAKESAGKPGKDPDPELAAENKTLKRQVRELERDKGNVSPETQQEIDRLKVGIKLGLTLAQTNRLQGKTFDEIEADAREFASDLGLELNDEGGAQPRGENGDENGGVTGPPRRGVIRAGDLVTGSGGTDGPVTKDTHKVLAGLPPL